MAGLNGSFPVPHCPLAKPQPQHYSTKVFQFYHGNVTIEVNRHYLRTNRRSRNRRESCYRPHRRSLQSYKVAQEALQALKYDHVDIRMVDEFWQRLDKIKKCRALTEKEIWRLVSARGNAGKKRQLFLPEVKRGLRGRKMKMARKVEKTESVTISPNAMSNKCTSTAQFSTFTNFSKINLVMLPKANKAVRVSWPNNIPLPRNKSFGNSLKRQRSTTIEEAEGKLETLRLETPGIKRRRVENDVKDPLDMPF